MRNITYNGLNMGDDNINQNNIVIQRTRKDVTLRAQIFNRENNHGSRITRTLAEGRLFTFTGIIGGETDGNYNGKTKLANILTLDEYHELSWEDDNGDIFKTQAKVYSMPVYNRERLGIDHDTFTFQLVSQNAEYTSHDEKTDNSVSGMIGGVELETELGIELSGFVGSIIVNNEGNHPALTKVTVTGYIEEPEILNITTGSRYGVTANTNLFIIDNRVSPIIVTDEGVNIKSQRKSGSKAITLQPGENEVGVVGKVFDYNTPVTFEIQYSNTFISS